MSAGSPRPTQAAQPARPRRAGRALRRPLKYALYAAARVPVRLLLGLLIGLRVRGTANMPRRGPLIVVANHLHNLDPVVLNASLPRPVYYMAKRELFEHRFLAWVIRNLGAFPVNRGVVDRAALRQARALLDEGLVVGLFPEGTRSTTGALGRAQPGVALVALQSGAPLLPVAITGTEVLPLDDKAAGRQRGRGGRRPRLYAARITVGRPFTLTEHAGARPDLAAATDRIMREIAALLPPAYHGIYADAAPDNRLPAASRDGELAGE